MVKPEDNCQQARSGKLSLPILQEYLCIGNYHLIIVAFDEVFRTAIIFQIIRRQESKNYSWVLFLNPMNPYLWMMLGLHSVFLVIVMRIFWWYYNRSKSTLNRKGKMPLIQEQVQHYLTMCSSYMGGGCGVMPHDDKSAIKEG